MIHHPPTGPGKLWKRVNRCHGSFMLLTQTHCICNINTQRYPWLPQKMLSASFLETKSPFIELFPNYSLGYRKYFVFLSTVGKIMVQVCWWNSTGPQPWSERVLGRELQGVVWDGEYLRGLLEKGGSCLALINCCHMGMLCQIFMWNL